MAQRVAGELYESLTGQLFELGRQLRQESGYPFDPLKLKRHLQDAIEGRFSSSGSIYPVTVDYGRGVEELVKAGRYDWSNPDITSRNFETRRRGTAELVVELIPFGRVISTDDVGRELDRMGYRPVELHELLAFGEKHPDVQQQFPVVALGSVWRDPHGYRRVLYLSGYGSERLLFLRWVGRGWGGVCRFAAVRK